MEFLGFALAAVIGLSLGLMGGGGSILTVPVLVYVMGFGAKTAIAMSLPVVGATSLVGAVGHWRAGNVHLRTALLFGVIAMVGSYFGARFAAMLSGAVQLVTLAVVMLLAAAAMLRARPARAASLVPPETATAGTPLPVAKILAVGLAVGALSGIVGIGGGFLIVPALVVLGRVPMKQAVGTSLLVIAMNAASGYAGYAGSVNVPWGFVAAFSGVATAGIVAGTYLVRFVAAEALKRGFAVFLLAVGGLMLFQNSSVFAGGESRSASARDGTSSATDRR